MKARPADETLRNPLNNFENKTEGDGLSEGTGASESVTGGYQGEE